MPAACAPCRGHRAQPLQPGCPWALQQASRMPRPARRLRARWGSDVPRARNLWPDRPLGLRDTAAVPHAAQLADAAVLVSTGPNRPRRRWPSTAVSLCAIYLSQSGGANHGIEIITARWI